METMGESLWIMPVVSPMVLYIATVLMSAGTFLAVLGYVLFKQEAKKNPRN